MDGTAIRPPAKGEAGIPPNCAVIRLSDGADSKEESWLEAIVLPRTIRLITCERTQRWVPRSNTMSLVALLRGGTPRILRLLCSERVDERTHVVANTVQVFSLLFAPSEGPPLQL